jgi:hypothetical protein
MNFKQVTQSRTGAVIAGATVLVTLGGIGGAVAAGQINSRDIKNDSIRSIDVKNGTLSGADVENGSIGMRDLNGHTKSEIRGEAGEQGPRGPQGPEGPAGPAGTASYAGPNWSIVDRNVIGNGDSYLRSGPATPPSGIGSLGIRTGDGTDAAAFGNQVDFIGMNVANLTELGYSIYTTGENKAKYAANLPNLKFEIDPNLTTSTSNFSTMVFVPNEIAANQWVAVDATDAAAGFWYLTGDAGAKTGCTQAAPTCSFDDLQAKLAADGSADASVYTSLVGKGRDYAFSGAVDKLVINEATYDFDPFGVTKTTS